MIEFHDGLRIVIGIAMLLLLLGVLSAAHNPFKGEQ